MRKLFLLATILALGSVSLHALTASCNILRQNQEGLKNAVNGQKSTDRNLQEYLRSSEAVYGAWCGAEPANSAIRSEAVDRFVEAYRAERFSEVSNMDLRPAMGVEMLALIGLTHTLPAILQADRRLREAWMQDCQETCFANSVSNSQNASMQLNCGMQVRDDLMQNLSAAPGVEAVKRMLWESPIAVLD